MQKRKKANVTVAPTQHTKDHYLTQIEIRNQKQEGASTTERNGMENITKQKLFLSKRNVGCEEVVVGVSYHDNSCEFCRVGCGFGRSTSNSSFWGLTEAPQPLSFWPHRLQRTGGMLYWKVGCVVL